MIPVGTKVRIEYISSVHYGETGIILSHVMTEDREEFYEVRVGDKIQLWTHWSLGVEDDDS